MDTVENKPYNSKQWWPLTASYYMHQDRCKAVATIGPFILRVVWMRLLQSCLIWTVFNTFYWDCGYNSRPFMEVPFQGSNLTEAQHAFNKEMSRVRVTAEWAFNEIMLYWSSMDYKRKMRIGHTPIGALFLAAMLLTNIRNCVYPKSISRLFTYLTPSLESILKHKHWT